MTDPALCAEGAARASGHRRAGDKHDELAAFHSITSSPRPISVGGIARSITWAVVRLQTAERQRQFDGYSELSAA